MWDAVVVGGGPAGAATSVHLARLGHAVLLLDRAEFPRPKPCGEGLFPAGVRELSDLGVLETVAPKSRQLSRLRFNLGSKSVEAPLGSFDAPAIGLDRRVLDSALLNAAEAAGVSVARGVVRSLAPGERGWTGVQTDDGQIDARLVVAADGLNSRLRRQAGLESQRKPLRYGVSSHVRLRRPLEPVVDVRFNGGWETYLTPVGEDVANLAVLAGRETMKAMAGDLCGAYTRMIEGHPVLADGWELLDEPRAAGPFPVDCQQAWLKNLVLVGDAAGFFDGITGEGMSLALVSARHCATAADAYLRGSTASAFGQYDRQRRGLARNSELLARLTLLLSRRQWTSALAIRNLGRRPDVFARMVAINSGELPLSALRPADLRGLMIGF